MNGKPIEMFGTNCPSITSRCKTSAPPVSTFLISWVIFARSAERIEGAICINFVKSSLTFRHMHYNQSRLAYRAPRSQQVRICSSAWPVSGKSGLGLGFILAAGASVVHIFWFCFISKIICFWSLTRQKIHPKGGCRGRFAGIRQFPARIRSPVDNSERWS